MVVQALCLDGSSPYNIPFRSALNWSFESGDYQTLIEAKGYNIISSDTILFEAFDGMTHLLLSQADSHESRSAVILLDHADQRIRNLVSESVQLPSHANPYFAKVIRCFEKVPMQGLRPGLANEISEIEKIMSEKNHQPGDNSGPGR